MCELSWITRNLLQDNKKDPGDKVQGTRFKVQGTRYKAQGTRYKVQGTGDKAQGNFVL